jgi:predicted amidophosphoribosyltransferase
MDCPICYEKVKNEIILSCNHTFCGKCIKKWSNNKKTCPLCRKIFKDAELMSFKEWIYKKPLHVEVGSTVFSDKDFLYWERMRIFS